MEQEKIIEKEMGEIPHVWWKTSAYRPKLSKTLEGNTLRNII